MTIVDYYHYDDDDLLYLILYLIDLLSQVCVKLIPNLTHICNFTQTAGH